MSTQFDIETPSVYLMFMFTNRVRRAFQAVARHVDVMPDTLVIRALEGSDHAPRARA